MEPFRRHSLAGEAGLAPTFIVAVIVLIALALTSPVTAKPDDDDWSAPVNLGPVVNSPFNDIAPAISKDGLSLYFQSNRPVGSLGGLDLWVSRRAHEDAPWGPPENLGAAINTPFTEGGPAFSRDGHWLFFNSNRPDDAVGGTDMWVSWRPHTNDDFGWEAPVNLTSLNSTAGDATGSYFENEDGSAPLFFFSSNRAIGGVAQERPYVSALATDGSWGAPTIITELDSPFDEMRPMVRFDGREIFFASLRPASFGLRDLWMSTRQSVFDIWSSPANLGAIVNTSANELTPYLSGDGLSLYFASDRIVAGQVGLVDIYVTLRERR
jgi:Tol biopolymer transport system component